MTSLKEKARSIAESPDLSTAAKLNQLVNLVGVGDELLPYALELCCELQNLQPERARKLEALIQKAEALCQ